LLMRSIAGNIVQYKLPQLPESFSNLSIPI